MDITKYSFEPHFAELLSNIQHCTFVAIDLELSGIPTRSAYDRILRGTPERPGKQTLQERYHECKQAAERYQVLQLGLTIVEEDEEHGERRSGLETPIN